MKNFAEKHPIFLLSLVFILYGIITGIILWIHLLNAQLLGGCGYIFAVGIVFLLFVVFILPMIQLAAFPVWRDPELIEDCEQHGTYLRKYANFLLRQFGEKSEYHVKGIDELKNAVESSQYDAVEYNAKVQPLVIQIHQELSDNVCGKIIHSYMRKTALMVMLSQKGFIDGLIMLIMQIKLIVAISRALGQRPSWISVCGCLFWIKTNSFLFALLDETDFVELAAREMLPVVLGESAVKAIPFVAKGIDIAVQGVTSMAIIYATGKAIQSHILDRQNKLSGKDRIKNRVDGYKESIKEIKDLGCFAFNKTVNAITGHSKEIQVS